MKHRETRRNVNNAVLPLSTHTDRIAFLQARSLNVDWDPDCRVCEQKRKSRGVWQNTSRREAIKVTKEIPTPIVLLGVMRYDNHHPGNATPMRERERLGHPPRQKPK